MIRLWKLIATLNAECAANDWWAELTRDEQEMYLQAHPKSRMKVTNQKAPKDYERYRHPNAGKINTEVDYDVEEKNSVVHNPTFNQLIALWKRSEKAPDSDETGLRIIAKPDGTVHIGIGYLNEHCDLAPNGDAYPWQGGTGKINGKRIFILDDHNSNMIPYEKYKHIPVLEKLSKYAKQLDSNSDL